MRFPIKKGLLQRTVSEVVAVNDVSLAIKEGETLGIVGESGSGKTTLGFALLRLQKSTGRIVYAGRDLQGLDARAMRPLRRDLQVVFQDPFGSLNPRMTVRQIVEEGLCVHAPNLSREARDEQLSTILEEVGLSAEMKERYAHEFSGGQRQRISIARAMILKPKLLVLDEPTSALDLSVQAQMVALLRKFQETYGISYLFISHDLRVVRALAHRILVMKQGKIVEIGDTGALFASPQTNYTKSLIAAAFLESVTA